MKIRLVLLTCALALVALAADVTGKWTATVAGRNGQTREVVMNLKADGNTVTGTVSGMRGAENQISDGKIDGDTVTFNVTMQMGDNTMKMMYTGKISGDTIHFKQEREGGQGRAQEFDAKRSTT